MSWCPPGTSTSGLLLGEHHDDVERAVGLRDDQVTDPSDRLQVLGGQAQAGRLRSRGGDDGRHVAGQRQGRGMRDAGRRRNGYPPF